MAVDKEKIEKVLSQLPAELQREVLDFAESLVRKTGTSVNGTSSVRTMFGIWNSGDPRSADNDRIDADIARELASPHKTE